MEITAFVLFWSSAFIIFWAMVGYPISLKLLGRVYKHRRIEKDYSHIPSVTIMVVAHNEEKVILEKLNNIISLDYPKNKIVFLIASDNSTDHTCGIVKEFIDAHPDYLIQLYEAKVRKGKTNAQNEAQKMVATEYLVMTDANSILEKNSLKELMAAFVSDDIAYVSGRLAFVNRNANGVSRAESRYWDGDVNVRDIEGRIQTITAGNGALYACRTKDYHDFQPIQCHDSAMPLFYALQGKRALANHEAVAYEKAGEFIGDEFGRKVRMNRMILKHIMPDMRILNFFKYGWFSYFYLGHRTCRYLLWISHALLFISNALLATRSWIYCLAFAGQAVFYAVALMGAKLDRKNRYVALASYYLMTVAAQWVGVYRIISGKSKPFWNKAESMR